MSRHDEGGRPTAIFLMGPTAAGKTDLALDLCDALPCDIISVDSAMIYRGMDIGTAKPSAEELSHAPHRLIDICDPADRYSAADFRVDALREMEAISRQGRIPLLVGGTMMYYKALLHGMADLPAADQALRSELEARADREGWVSLHEQLGRLDPVAAEVIHPNNRQRVLRALEVVLVSGRPISEAWADRGNGNNVDYPYLTQWQADASADLPYNVIQLSIAPGNRSVLHDRIRLRFLKMLELGFIDEVRALRARGDLHVGLPSVRCVGYRQAWSWLDGDVEYETFVEKGIAATRQLAKRQLTWLRKWPDLHWIDSEASGSLSRALKILQSRTTLIK
ncbi:tRNA (adenosine(37)-N6)-dimethylallyltransferase MiaA [Marinobacter halodurans]|uniref:tRNA dimethylallyltransferase n=1 Tax=Marinobacter halodurans TaxID=2528979 RepID=A0ABY1ZPF1_9GAMM|nr:tRNA (adenosine(37)-N6)-dimethylallyltransferase MiaA [Marinobacter halodurans]TBW56864.1 tRNA (adenosine(37)-N6)-dimethylallyltransferase MiaA [Marinobacter halodurans]